MRIGVLYNLVDRVERGFAKDAISDNEIVETVGHVVKTLSRQHEVFPVRARPDLLGKITHTSFDAVFNLCEGFQGKVQGEHWMAGFLDLHGIPYTGSGPLSLGMCLNKMRTKQILVANGAVTPNYQVFHSASQNLSPDLKFPLFVKPVQEDASVGITNESLVNNKLELFKRVDYVNTHYSQPALVEEYIDGREINVAVMGNGPKAESLPVSEILFDLKEGPNIVNYDAKWVEDSPAYKGTVGVCPAELPPHVEAIVKRSALEAYRIMGCNDYARVDFRLRDDVPFVLEVNPNPGINMDSGFPRSCAKAGFDYEEMIERILRFALERHGMVPVPSSPEPPIAREGGLVALRPRYEHIGVLLKWFNDPEVSMFMDSPGANYGMDDLVEDFLVYQSDDVACIVLEEATGTPVGYGSVYSINRENGSADMSFLVGDPSMRGKGYGRSILRMLQRIAFDEMGLHSIDVTVTAENEPSLRSLKACGFKRIGTLKEYHRVGGKRYDEVVLQCLATYKRMK
jgi:D-alanine-D-alanine ligase